MTNLRDETVIVLDFGSQYTQLIARRVREQQVFARILPYSTPLAEIEDLVRREWRRRAGDRALRGYLDQLREDGDVVVRIDFDD